MARAIVEASRRLAYAPEDLCALVADVRSYPTFIPWVKSLDVLSEKQDGETHVLVARAEVGWSALRERFTTQVRTRANTVDVSLVSGPFHSLENRWRFLPEGEGARIEFYVAFEFRNRLLQAVAMLNRDVAATRIIAAFEKEAAHRFGAKV